MTSHEPMAPVYRGFETHICCSNTKAKAHGISCIVNS